MTMGKKGIALLKKFEGFRLNAYDDKQPKVKLTEKTKIKGTLTIGIGHTGKVDGKPICWNTKIKSAKAYELFRSDIKAHETNVRKYNTKYKWTQNEFDACVCFDYGTVAGIHGLTKNGRRTKEEIAETFLLYIMKGTSYETGLRPRRKAEHDLFTKN